MLPGKSIGLDRRLAHAGRATLESLEGRTLFSDLTLAAVSRTAIDTSPTRTSVAGIDTSPVLVAGIDTSPNLVAGIDTSPNLIAGIDTSPTRR
jgi:hypothetical protein